MAQVKIADLVKKTTPAETDLMVIQDAGATKGITWSDLFSPIYNWIGNLATLKTTHKNTFVGAANELFDKIEAVEANNSLLRISSTYNSGATVIMADSLGVTNPSDYYWIIQPLYTSSAGVMNAVPQVTTDRLVIYLRMANGQAPPDNSYAVDLLRVQK